VPGEANTLRIQNIGHPLNGVEFCQCVRGCLGVAGAGPVCLADVNDEECGVESAGVHPLDIDLHIARKRIYGSSGVIERDIHMRIECQAGGMNGLRVARPAAGQHESQWRK
jgi:hypothetical protein